MTQLSLFDSPVAVLTPPVADLKTNSDEQSVVPKTREAISHGIAAADDRRCGENPAAGSSLRRLAELIRQGKSDAATARSGGVQRIGDLARLALERHDMVARRKAARTLASSRGGAARERLNSVASAS